MAWPLETPKVFSIAVFFLYRVAVPQRLEPRIIFHISITVQYFLHFVNMYLFNILSCDWMKLNCGI